MPKKSAVQLQREIDAALAQPSGGKRSHATKKRMHITLSQSDSDDGYVTVYCDDKKACRDDQSIEGSNWETPRDMDGGYAIIQDRPSLVADLTRKGYDVDDSEYSPPNKEDMKRWAEAEY